MTENHLPFLFLLLLLATKSTAQQAYVDNKQEDCERYRNSNITLGFICNAPANSCNSYLAFRSTPLYNNSATIARLLSVDANQIASLNNISISDPLPEDTLLTIPVTCDCYNHRFYQHNTSYIIREEGEDYYTIANATYQALTTCQTLQAQNPTHAPLQLYSNLKISVALRCAFPTRNQTDDGFNYLLTYLLRQREYIELVAEIYSAAGATSQSIRDANQLTATQMVYYFTPILVPLTREPTVGNVNTTLSPDMPPPSPPMISTIPYVRSAISSRSSSHKRIFVGVGIGVGVFVLFLLPVLFWWISFRHKRQHSPPEVIAGVGNEYSANDSMSKAISSAIESLTVYSFGDVDKATGSFAEGNRIKGSSVFRGSINGDNCAVKIMKGDISREIDIHRQINHSHIVRLSGFCLYEGSTYLVYEYALNGSLTDSISAKPVDNNSPVNRLDWKQRVQIAYDVADALNYLHNSTNLPYIHNNLKSSNVLLDGNMRAKIANFGLARILDENDVGVMTRHVVGTFGYMAPEYVEIGLVTQKVDVFALGVVLLELLSGKESRIDDRDREGDGELLLYEVIEVVLGGDNVREKLREFMDPLLVEEYPLELASSMAEIARSCVAHDRSARPTLSVVFVALEKILASSLDWDPSHEQRSESLSFSTD